MKIYPTVALLLFFICGNLPGRAQISGPVTVDSLLSELGRAREDTNKVSILNQCSYLLSRTNPGQGLTYSGQAMELAERLNWPKGLAEALDYAALCSNVLEDTAHARSYALKSVEIARKIHDTLRLVSAITRLGYVAYKSPGQKQQARAYGQEVLKLAMETKDTKALALAYMHMGFLLNGKKEFSEAVRYDTMSISLFAMLNDKYSEAASIANQATEYCLKNRYKEALDTYIRALKLVAPFGNTEYKAIVLSCLSDTYYRLSDYSNAEKTCLEALEIDKQLGKKITVAEDNTDLAMIYFRMKSYAEAYNYATQALGMSATTSDAWYVKSSKRILKKIDKRTMLFW